MKDIRLVAPMAKLDFVIEMVPLIGLEPTTPSLRMMCST